MMKLRGMRQIKHRHLGMVWALECPDDLFYIGTSIEALLRHVLAEDRYEVYCALVYGDDGVLADVYE